MFKLIISVLGLVLAGAMFFVYTKPTYDAIQGQRDKIGQYDQALDKAAELQQLKQSLLSRYNAFNPADLERIHKLLPDHVDNVRLVLDLDHMAASRGLALQNVIISAPLSTSREPGIIGAIGGGQQHFDSLTLRFTTQGTYDDFVAFLEDLESSLRIVDLVSLAIDNDSPPGANEPVYRFDIMLRTYWLN